MSQPVTFQSTTPRFALPHLFPAQAQKEFIVNEAHARLDMLLHCAAEGEANDPPGTAADGETWIVGSAPTGAWSGHAGHLAGWQAGTWLFVAPPEGMRLFDRAAGQVASYDGEWRRAAAPQTATGGVTVDTQARAAIADLVQILRTAGILSHTE